MAETTSTSIRGLRSSSLPSALKGASRSFLCVALLLAAGCSRTGSMQTSVSVDGIRAYLGVVPAELIAEHAPDDARMVHAGESASASGTHHLLVALYDSTTGRRITDAVIKAVVTPQGGVSREKPLQPIRVAGALTYGNYFLMPATGPYEIAVIVHRPSAARDPVIHFRYQH